MTRKLIRPNLSEIRKVSKPVSKKKTLPQTKTNAESFYYLKQINNKTKMVIALIDGEILRGVIDWYDENCFKFKSLDGKNILLYKNAIKYMYKEQDCKESKNEPKLKEE